LYFDQLVSVSIQYACINPFTKILTLLSSFRWRSLFEKCPQAKVLFGFPIDIDPTSPEVLTSKRFLMHAAYLIQMIDTALNMLGPDIELLTEIMTELGVKHVRYGVKPEMFPIMGDALIHTLEETLKADDFTEPIKEAWIEVYKALSQDMIRAQVQLKRRQSKDA
jgi:methyl-accepting chemotaxis protein